MVVNDWIHLIAGIFILAGLALGYWLSPYWLLVPAFVGLNLAQFGITKFCPLGFILKMLGVPEDRCCS